MLSVNMLNVVMLSFEVPLSGLKVWSLYVWILLETGKGSQKGIKKENLINQRRGGKFVRTPVTKR